MRLALFAVAGAMGMAGVTYAQDARPALPKEDFNLYDAAMSGGAPLKQDEPVERQELERTKDEPRLSDRELFSLGLGPQAGYIRAKGSDNGTWFGGVQARMWVMEFLGVEGAITAHRDEMFDGDVEVIQYPVQLSVILSPFPGWDLRPYAIGGVGWYYTRTEFDDSLLIDDDAESDNLFGVHIGGGVEADIGKRIGLNVDIRYTWMNGTDFEDADEAIDDIDDRDFDQWQATAGLTFRF